jgi:uncharacterized membrane protein YphA (DoxX/SURF4 family)
MEVHIRNIEKSKYDKARMIFNIVYNIVYFFMSIVLIFAGISKLYNPFPLLEDLMYSTPFPTLMLIGLVALIAILETLLGIMLALKIKIKENLFFAGILFSIIFLFSLYAYVNGYSGETGSFGGIIKSHFDNSLLIVNSVFLFFSIALLIKKIEIPEDE